MSEHSIEELERQLQSARDRAKQAVSDVRAAEERLKTARNEASGIIGHALEYDWSTGSFRNRRTTKRKLLVDRVEPHWDGGLMAFGKLIIASGAVGIRRDSILVTKTKDLGPYTAPAA